MERVSRRRTLATGAAGLSLPVLAACGSQSGAAGDRTAATTPDDAVPTGSAPDQPPPTDDPGTSEPTVVVAAADVPVGGGVIPDGAGIVVTQPTRGTFRGFDPTCTHRGCLVSEVTDTIECLCHSSSFDLRTGAPLSGPAPSPLAPIDVRVVDGQVQRA